MIIKILGIFILMLAVMLGFMVMGGNLLSLWHPSELIVIWGSALAVFFIASPAMVIKRTFIYTGRFMMGGRVDKQIYAELMALMDELFRIGRSEGMLALQKHVEEPTASPVFQRYDRVFQHLDLRTFIAKNLELMSMVSLKTFNFKGHLDDQIHVLIHDYKEVPKILNKIGDWLPGFGIMAAIMGVILTMGQLGGDVTVIGASIGAALVGTFIGIFTAFGVVAPMAHAIEIMINQDQTLLEAAAVGMHAYAEGNSPGVVLQIAKQQIPPGYLVE